jgi:hypothetical protein
MQSLAQNQVLLGNKQVKKVKIRRYSLNWTEQVATWLEGDDTQIAKLFAYGVCSATGAVITGALLRCLL